MQTLINLTPYDMKPCLLDATSAFLSKILFVDRGSVEDHKPATPVTFAPLMDEVWPLDACQHRCWSWTGGRRRGGMLFAWRGYQWSARRYAARRFLRELDEFDAQVRVLCGHSDCVNPWHSSANLPRPASVHVVVDPEAAMRDLRERFPGFRPQNQGGMAS